MRTLTTESTTPGDAVGDESGVEDPDDASSGIRIPEGRAHDLGWARIAIHATLILVSLVAITPFVWALLTSFKPLPEISAAPLRPIPENPTLDNYRTLWYDHPFDRWILNSLIITVGTVFVTLLLDSLAGFALAKGRFRGRRLVYLLVIGTLVIPPQVILVPLYLNMQSIGWGNTYWAIMVLWIAGPFGTFMMRQYFLSVPDSLIDAARIDGCGLWDMYLRIAVPLAKPALSSLAIFLFIFVWGAFLWPLIILDSSSMFPLQVGIGLLTGPYTQNWGVLLAASIIASAPVITAYVFAQREFMEGIALTGGKG